MAWKKTDDIHYQNIADSIRYAKDGTEYRTTLERAKEEIMQDNEYFDDISEVVQNKTGHTEPYAKDDLANVINEEWVQPTLITKQITENGTYAAEDDNADGYSEVVVEVGETIEEKAVNFYDYDGTVLYAYTAQEALELTELPEAPTHEGLTFQEWNRTLAQLQAYVTDYGIGDAGATYITDDGATRLYLTIPDSSSLTFNLQVSLMYGTLTAETNGTVLNSETETSQTPVDHVLSFSLPSPESYPAKYVVSLKFVGLAQWSKWGFNNDFMGKTTPSVNALKKLEIGNSVNRINGNAFRNCTSLKTVIIPAGISINNNAFSGCVSLSTVIYPNGVTYLSNSCFINCSSLSRVLLPNEISRVGQSAFEFCSSLDRVLLPQGLSSIEYAAFKDCANLKKICIPNTITSVGNNAFTNCISLMAINFNDCASSIGDYIFYNCGLLFDVLLSESMTTIGEGQFRGCIHLNEIKIPANIKTIKSSAFLSCSSLAVLDLTSYTDPNNLPTFSNSNFLSGTPTDQIIYVANQEMLTAFSSATNISVYANRFQIKGGAS